VTPIPSSTRFLDSAVLGTRILLREWTPADGPGSGNKVLVLHGLGDHSARHGWAAGMLAAAGFRPVGFDWPGNGGSDGVRGDMPRVPESAALLEELLESMDLDPVGIFAHSTGAFLALSWLAGRANRYLEHLRWIWLSSPLIRPSHGQPALKIALARALSRHFPHMTLGNGVRTRDCYHTGLTLTAESRFSHDGGHHRISLGFAMSLLETEDRIPGAAADLPPGLAYLLTQGSEDRICPPLYAERLYQALPGTRKTCLFASGSRHEPFREPEPESFTNAVRSWLVRV
jgi:alpha-beta hydrolase superfamily lysophospholipase